MQKWEYCQLSIWKSNLGWKFTYKGKEYPSDKLLNAMDLLGKEGWELVAAMPFTNVDWYDAGIGSETGSYDLFFKRLAS